jgi:Uma2 family endonuclease
VDGEVIMMAPDNVPHAFLNNWLIRLLGEFAEVHDLGVITGPNVMIRLAARRRRRVPDILFLAKERLGLLRHAHIEGAPDLAIEIVSPDSQSRDWRDKYNDYENAGVREYWVIDPASQRVEAYSLGEDKLFHKIDEREDKIISTVLPGLYLRPSWLWQQPLPLVGQMLRELGINL